MSRRSGRAQPAVLDRLLLGLVAVVVFAFAVGVRDDRTTSTFALLLAGIAGLLALVALLLPFLSGLSSGVRAARLAPSVADARQLVTTMPRDADGLAEVLRGPDSEYAVVALGNGDRWLASRLLVFAVTVQQIRQVRCLVLTADQEPDSRERYVGLVSPDGLRRALTWQYPWLESALADAWQAVSATASTANHGDRVSRLTEHSAESLYDAYVRRLRTRAPVSDPCEWTELPDGQWEHAPLLESRQLTSVLGSLLDTRCARRRRSRTRQLDDVLAVEAEYVALVDSDLRFVSLVDRQALLEDLAAQSRSPRDRTTTGQ